MRRERGGELAGRWTRLLRLFLEMQNVLNELFDIGAVGHAGIVETLCIQAALDEHGGNSITVLEGWETPLNLFDPVRPVRVLFPLAARPPGIDQELRVRICHSHGTDEHDEFLVRCSIKQLPFSLLRVVRECILAPSPNLKYF